jgi:hypothetical protein
MMVGSMVSSRIGTIPMLLLTLGGSIGGRGTLSVGVAVGGRGAEVRAILPIEASSLAHCAPRLGLVAMVMLSGCAVVPVL